MIDLNPSAYSDYKLYILALEEQSRSFQRGFRRRLAEAIGCQSAFVTQILGGSAHLSLEQGLKAAQHFGLTARELKYFMLQIEHARAGTEDLRLYFARALEDLRREILDLRHNVVAHELSEEGKLTYYSHWSFAAIHILVTIPRFQKIEAVAEALGLREEEAQVALRFLVDTGLVTNENGRLVPGQTHLHLGSDSRMIRHLHTQWRLRALESLHRVREDDVHYSTVSSLSRADIQVLKARMVEWIRAYTETIRPSPEEELCAFSLDFYRLT